MKDQKVRVIPLLAIGALATFAFFCPPPTGLPTDAWKLFVIFLFTIVGIIIKAAPMGVMSIFGMSCTALSSVIATGNPKKAIDIALSGLGSTMIWLIVLSFFISRGFIKTGLGTRIAYVFLSWFGKNPLGIAYSLNLADLLLAPAIPSNTARGGGIIFPVMKSICISLDSHPSDNRSRRKIGSYLTLSSYNGNLITSAMFLTATAGNPLSQKLAQSLGISLTWGGWATASLVPGLLVFILMPWFLYKFYPPQLKDTLNAKHQAAKKLKELGSLRREEAIMLFCFILMVVLWIFGDRFGVEATTAGFIGLSILLISSVLSWDDVLGEKAAWDTLLWFSVLVMMGSQLNTLGFIPWITAKFQLVLSGLAWEPAFILIVLSYCYSHYLFASATAHIASMYAAFLSLGMALGVPGGLLALMLGILTSLMGTQTHYGHGVAPVYYGSGFVELKEWWTYGFFLSVLYISVFMTVGVLWWKMLGVF